MERTRLARKQPVKVQTMSSNLPLLFANARPTTLNNMTEDQLEKFVNFMTKCSFIQKDPACSKNEILGERPKWWPLNIPFKIPLAAGYPNNYTDRRAMLKTLICCCYTFYNCEFLLKFSAELAEMPPGSLCYVPSATGNITLIYTVHGALLVKCRNENLTYDEEVQSGDAFQNRSFNKNVCVIDEMNCIDITDSLSDNDDEIHFKQGNLGLKRKLNGNYKTMNHKRPYYGPRKEQVKENIEIIDLTVETPEVGPVEEQNKIDFFNAFGLERIENVNNHSKRIELNKKLLKAGRRNYLLPFSTKFGQQIYINNKFVGNNYHIDRVNRYCSTVDLPKMQLAPQAAESSDDELEDNCEWTHVYKPGRRCQKPQRLHRGPSVKPCIVKLTRLSDEDIKKSKTKKVKSIRKPRRQRLRVKNVCSQLKKTEGFGSELTQSHVKAEHKPILDTKESFKQSSKVMDTTDPTNTESVSPVEQHVGLSDSETSNVTVIGNGDTLHLVEERPITKSENNKKSTLELKRSFPSNYLSSNVTSNKLVTNCQPLNNKLKYIWRKANISKSLDDALNWVLERNGSGLKHIGSVNSQQLQENLVPHNDISFKHSMCVQRQFGGSNGKHSICYCCDHYLYEYCTYSYIYKADKAEILEEKNYKLLKAHFMKLNFDIIVKSIDKLYSNKMQRC